MFQARDCARFASQDSTPYILPWSVGDGFDVIRTITHYTPANGGVGLHAIDIDMPVGTPVTAARGGVVAVRSHGPGHLRQHGAPRVRLDSAMAL